MIVFRLSDSISGKDRTGTLVPAGWGVVDAYLTIRQGRVGPRGGRSGLKVNGYFVQEFPTDPEYPMPGRVFMLAKDSDADPEIYETLVAVRGTHGYCTCKGFGFAYSCKHIEALYHLVYVVGWGHVPETVVATELAELPEPDCVDTY